MQEVREYGFQKNILKYTENCVSIAVTVDDTDVQADAYGKKIIPAGTFVGGGILENPNKIATKVKFTNEQASVTTTLSEANTNLKFTAVPLGVQGNGISITYTKPSSNDSALQVNVSNTDIEVSLATNSSGAVTTTANDILTAVNADSIANELILVSLAANSTGVGVVSAMAKKSLSGGGTTATGTAEAVLLNDVDVTYKAEPVAAVIAGVINLNKLPNVPTDSIKASLKNITFMR